MSAADAGVLEELGELIEDLTTTGQASLDETKLKKLKSICKTSNAYINHAFHLVMTQLKKNHAEIRLSSFQIISELFTRSHAFRELLLGEFQAFLELVVASQANKPLPPPSSTAKILKTKAVDAIESWHQKYGDHYKKLDLGYHYIKRIKHVEFDAIRNRTLVERRHALEREQRKQRILKKKIDKVENEIAEHLGHIELCITEMNNCFKLLLPHPDDYEVHSIQMAYSCNSKLGHEKSKDKQELNEGSQKDNMGMDSCTGQENDEIAESSEDGCNDVARSDEFVDDTQTDGLKDHGLASRNFEINIKINEMQPSVSETDDNAIVLDTTREMNKEITHKYLPMVNQWLNIFTKAGYSQRRIQSVIDLKRQLVSTKEKFFELNISPLKVKQPDNNSDDDDDDDDDDMVDVPEKEGIEFIPPERRAEYGLEPVDLDNSEQRTVLSSNDQPKSSKPNDAEFLKQHGFTLKDAEDPTSHARALLEARKRFGDFDTIKRPQSSLPVLAQSSSAVYYLQSQDNSKRKELLDKAPIVNFDMDLYHWNDPNYEPPKLIRSHNFHNFWASKDAEEEQVFEEAKGSMVKRKIAFGGKFEPVKWACRAPLPSGKLCPRKDRYKCPFHGTIIARDDKGKPVEESSYSSVMSTSTSTSSLTSTYAGPSTSAGLSTSTQRESWQDLQQDIEAATGIDLNPKGKKRKARKPDNPDRKLSRKEKYARLTDIHKTSKSPQSRLEKKVLNKGTLKRVAEEMDSLATKKVLDKFGDQFNYHFSGK